MTVLAFVPFVAAACGVLLAFASLLRKPRSLAAWCFGAGMVVLGLDSLFTGLSLHSTLVEEGVVWLTLAFVVKCFAPLPWLCFSLTYSRGDYRTFLSRWRLPLLLLGVLPILLVLGFPGQVLRFVPLDSPEGQLVLRFGQVGTALNLVILVAFVLVLVNLEQTLRSAVGTMRWRVKFVVLGVVVMLGTQLYTRSQAVLFLAPDLALSGVESSAVLIGCVFLTFAYARSGMTEIDVYPSTAILRSSFTVLIVGGYLFVVGVLAQVVERFGGAESFQLEAFVLLLGMAGLTVLLLSDRLRQRVQSFTARHFRRAQHDSTRVWTLFSQRLAVVKDRAGLCAVSARAISDTFEVLSVTVWLLDEQGQLEVGASTERHGDPDHTRAAVVSNNVVTGLCERTAPFDLDVVQEAWAEEFRRLNPAAFTNGGHRWCIPLRAGGRELGTLVLADRVNQAVYTPEELELLACIGAQISAVLMSLRLASELAVASELDAFRTMSAFFVHDLKNAATALNMTLRNVPTHFDDPAFREDAMRVVGNTAQRIDEMITRLGALRERPDVRPVPTDMNRIVQEAVERAGDMPGVEIATTLQPLPPVLADRDQIRSVVINLVLNARDAQGGSGRIEIRTEHSGAQVVLSVADRGSGMSPAFIRDSLFRPFQSTKKKGLGIGLFQSRTVVHAHGGTIQVQSEPGAGSTFRVMLPADAVAVAGQKS